MGSGSDSVGAILGCLGHISLKHEHRRKSGLMHENWVLFGVRKVVGKGEGRGACALS
jgi:hypothetical protein